MGIRSIAKCLIIETGRFMKCYFKYLKSGGVDDTFKDILNTLRQEERKNNILKYYKNHSSEAQKYAHELKCLEKGLPYLMTCDTEDFFEKKKIIDEEMRTTAFDDEAQMYYILRNGKKLYLKREIDSLEKVRCYYEYLAYEQTENSPHKYLGEEFDIENDSVVVDCGAAEGVFGLDNIEKIKLLYLFECDKEWIEALQYTFAPYKNKVQIIDKYVGDSDSDFMITLDTFFRDKKIDFLKMDVEGYELAVLEGAKELLKNANPLKIATAAYHSREAETEIVNKLKNFRITQSKGFLLHGWENAEPPYFRTGIIRAEKEI